MLQDVQAIAPSSLYASSFQAIEISSETDELAASPIDCKIQELIRRCSARENLGKEEILYAPYL
jgi:hypothetical protein